MFIYIIFIMVKNVHGGNKHKSQGRKFTVKVSHKLRIAENDGELYGIVTKMLGNGMFYTLCIDNIERLGHIRGKFSGRGKRDNIVEIGKWVLVGEREWEVSGCTNEKTKKKLHCDLLEIYNELDKEKLIDSVSANWNILISQNTAAQMQKGENAATDFEFATERDEEMNKLMDEINNNKTTAIGFTTEAETDSNNWIDDI